MGGRQTKARTAERVRELDTGIRGALEALDVRVHHAIVRRARSKIIEANFVNTANYDRSSPFWCGHKPTARPERFQALLDDHERWLKGEIDKPFPTIEEVAGDYDGFLESLNERPHSGEGMRKKLPTGLGWYAPNEVWELNIGEVDRRTVSPEVLQFSFQKRWTLKVRHGEVCATFGGRQFHYRLLDSSVDLMKLNGNDVELGFDPLDLEVGAVYFENRFIGLVGNVELRRMGGADFVDDERDRRRSLREVKNFVKTVHNQVYVPGHAERAARRAAVQPVRIEPDRPEVAVSVPAPILEAAAAAERDKAFSFAASREDEAIAVREAQAPASDPDEGEFHFFSSRGDK